MIIAVCMALLLTTSLLLLGLSFGLLLEIFPDLRHRRGARIGATATMLLWLGAVLSASVAPPRGGLVMQVAAIVGVNLWVLVLLLARARLAEGRAALEPPGSPPDRPREAPCLPHEGTAVRHPRPRSDRRYLDQMYPRAPGTSGKTGHR